MNTSVDRFFYRLDRALILEVILTLSSTRKHVMCGVNSSFKSTLIGCVHFLHTVWGAHSIVVSPLSWLIVHSPLPPVHPQPPPPIRVRSDVDTLGECRCWRRVFTGLKVSCWLLCGELVLKQTHTHYINTQTHTHTVCLCTRHTPTTHPGRHS